MHETCIQAVTDIAKAYITLTL